MQVAGIQVLNAYRSLLVIYEADSHNTQYSLNNRSFVKVTRVVTILAGVHLHNDPLFMYMRN
jgi:hypothetical protein